MTLRYHPTSFLKPLLACISNPVDGRWSTLGIQNPALVHPTASGADAIKLALALVGGSGRVIAPAYTCARVIEAIQSAGDSPLLVDIDPIRGTFVREELLRAIRNRPKAILLTHLFGVDVDTDWILQTSTEHGFPVIEDASLLLDLRKPTGTWAPLTVLSFGRGKPLGLGGGGALVIRDGTLWRRLENTSAGHGVEGRFGMACLFRGAIRDSWASLFLAAMVTRWRSHKPQHSLSSEPIVSNARSHSMSPTSRKTIESLATKADIDGREFAASLALARYRTAFSDAGLNIRGVVGHRLPPGTVSPTLALLCGQSQQVVGELARMGIDCPRYWRYSVASRLQLPGFPGARILSEDLIFLPLHSKVGVNVARRVADVLCGSDLSSFS